MKYLPRLSASKLVAYTVYASTLWLLFVSTAAAQDADGFKFDNPIAANSIGELFLALLRIVMIVAVPIVIFFIVYAGFKYVTARGNAEEIQTATRALTYAIVGGLIIIGSMAIVEIVTNLVDAFRND